MKTLLVSLMALFTLSLCSQTTTTKNVSIAPYLTFQNYEHFKRLTLHAPDTHIEYIEGFEFDWGYNYKLRVTETEMEEELSDGTKYTYALEHIISKTKVLDTTEFILYIDPYRYYDRDATSKQEMNRTLQPIAKNRYVYFDKVEIEVPEHLRKKFEKVLDGHATLGTFLYIDANRIKLLHL